MGRHSSDKFIHATIIVLLWIFYVFNVCSFSNAVATVTISNDETVTFILQAPALLTASTVTSFLHATRANVSIDGGLMLLTVPYTVDLVFFFNITIFHTNSIFLYLFLHFIFTLLKILNTCYRIYVVRGVGSELEIVYDFFKLTKIHSCFTTAIYLFSNMNLVHRPLIH